MILMIIIMSILYYLEPYFLGFSWDSIGRLYYWTFLTSLLIIPILNIFDVVMMGLLIVFIYILGKDIEREYGAKPVIAAFIIGGLASLASLLIAIYFQYGYNSSGILMHLIPVGFGSSGLYSMIGITIALEEKEWHLEKEKKSRDIFLFLIILIRLIPGIYLLDVLGSESLYVGIYWLYLVMEFVGALISGLIVYYLFLRKNILGIIPQEYKDS